MSGAAHRGHPRDAPLHRARTRTRRIVRERCGYVDYRAPPRRISIIRSAPAGWATTLQRSSMHVCGFTEHSICAWSMPRSCRRSFRKHQRADDHDRGKRRGYDPAGRRRTLERAAQSARLVRQSFLERRSCHLIFTRSPVRGFPDQAGRPRRAGASSNRCAGRAHGRHLPRGSERPGRTESLQSQGSAISQRAQQLPALRIGAKRPRPRDRDPRDGA